MEYGVSHFTKLGDTTLHYRCWGQKHKPCVILWHGVTGNSMDHAHLADLLSDQFYIICPDGVGCGLSNWPSSNHHASLSYHVELVDQLMAELGIKECHWVGTSKGGALGICYSARGQNCKINKLILHDVGPSLPETFRKAVARHIGDPPRFSTLPEFEARLRKTLGREGLELDSQHWKSLAQSWSRRCDDGSISYHYSPDLAQQFYQHPEDFDLWEDYQDVNAKVLLLRGEHSTVMTDKDTERMLKVNPNTQIKCRSGGHISFLSSPAEAEIVQTFLAA